jgi:nucleoid-associated protein YgaU
MNLSVRYTLFREDGTPVRATAKITLQEAEDEHHTKRQNPTSYSEPGLRFREVLPRDTLAQIAYEEYGDATVWRRIADRNRLDDPLNLRPGQILVIPPLF